MAQPQEDVHHITFVAPAGSVVEPSTLPHHTLKWLMKHRTSSAVGHLTLGRERYQQLSEIFSGLDFDGNGSVDFTELLEAMDYVQDKRNESAQKVLNSRTSTLVEVSEEGLDSSGSMATRSSLVLRPAAVNQEAAKQESRARAKRLEHIFRKIDTDGSGTIDFNEFVAVMSHNSSGALLQDEMDVDMDMLHRLFFDFANGHRRQRILDTVEDPNESHTQKWESFVQLFGVQHFDDPKLRDSAARQKDSCSRLQRNSQTSRTQQAAEEVRRRRVQQARRRKEQTRQRVRTKLALSRLSQETRRSRYHADPRRSQADSRALEQLNSLGAEDKSLASMCNESVSLPRIRTAKSDILTTLAARDVARAAKTGMPESWASTSSLR